MGLARNRPIYRLFGFKFRLILAGYGDAAGRRQTGRLKPLGDLGQTVFQAEDPELRTREKKAMHGQEMMVAPAWWLGVETVSVKFGDEIIQR